MKIKREDFLHQLESVHPGLATRELIEQSKCVVFDEGKLKTFNEEVACSIPCSLADSITGAVPSDKLTEQLRKWKDDEVDVEATKNELILTGRNKKAGFRFEADILLPLDHLESPTDWVALPPDFGDAVNVVKQCTSAKTGDVWTTFIHLHPSWIEACDNSQVCRWNLQLSLKEPILVKAGSIKHVPYFGVTEAADGEAWIHFRNAAGLVISVRRFVDEYIDLAPMLDCDGIQFMFPVGFTEVMENAKIALIDNQDVSVKVTLEQGKMLVEAKGIDSWYKHKSKIEWSGDKLSFISSPQLLCDLLKRHNLVRLSKTRIKAETDKYTWVAVLMQKEEKNNEA